MATNEPDFRDRSRESSRSSRSLSSGSGQVPAMGAPASLRFLTGPRAGLVVPLDKETITLGRSSKCDLLLESMNCSREHARIHRVGESFFIENLSRNGSFLNQLKLGDARVPLGNGDLITIAEFALSFHLGAGVEQRSVDMAATVNVPVIKEEVFGPGHGGKLQNPRVSVPTVWFLSLQARSAGPITVGHELTLVLRLEPDERAGSRRVELAACVLELAVAIEAPGFQLEGDHLRTLPVSAGRSTGQQVIIRLLPVASGEFSIQLLVYSGNQVADVPPVELLESVSVAPPPEVADFQGFRTYEEIPEPHPDVVLFVTVEGTAAGEQLVLHISCPALALEVEHLEPPLALSRQDIAGLNHLAVQAGLKSSSADGLAGLRVVGRRLYDRLVPEGHRIREVFRRICALAEHADTAWSLLVVADDCAVLPWEFVCPYGEDTPGSELFFGERFVLSHWVGGRGLTPRAEVPLGKIEERSTNTDINLARVDWPEAERVIRERRLELALRRPLVSLSRVVDRSVAPASVGAENGPFESAWVLPLLHAGATAVVGPRWPTDPGADLLFVERLYVGLRSGATVGAAVRAARDRVRAAFPQRADWLAFAHFGHPDCRPYLVEPAQGFTLFEVLDHPEGAPFRGGAVYRFRASYRADAPVWYAGKVSAGAAAQDGGDVTVLVLPLSGTHAAPQVVPLQSVDGGSNCQGEVALALPTLPGAMTLLVRFQQGITELRTELLTFDVVVG